MVLSWLPINTSLSCHCLLLRNHVCIGDKRLVVINQICGLSVLDTLLLRMEKTWFILWDVSWVLCVLLLVIWVFMLMKNNENLNLTIVVGNKYLGCIVHRLFNECLYKYCMIHVLEKINKLNISMQLDNHLF